MRLVKKQRWGSKNKKQHDAIKRYSAQKRKLILELKSVPCADCKQEYSSEAMDFDHVPGRGGKLGLVPNRPSLRAILAEARKCDVVCSNCHRVRTHRRRVGTRLERRERENFLDGIAAAVEREREALRVVISP